jgi:hypothetical protein
MPPDNRTGCDRVGVPALSSERTRIGVYRGPGAAKTVTYSQLDMSNYREAPAFAISRAGAGVGFTRRLAPTATDPALVTLL